MGSSVSVVVLHMLLITIMSIPIHQAAWILDDDELSGEDEGSEEEEEDDAMGADNKVNGGIDSFVFKGGRARMYSSF